MGRKKAVSVELIPEQKRADETTKPALMTWRSGWFKESSLCMLLFPYDTKKIDGFQEFYIILYRTRIVHSNPINIFVKL